MIRLKSPYYITSPLVSTATGLTCTYYTLYIYVWTGAKASVPGTATHTITKRNFSASTGTDTIDIAPIIYEAIAFTPQTDSATGLIDGVNQVWVKTEVTYITTNPTDATTPQEAATVLASLGYTYGNAGANQVTAAGAIMFSGDNLRGYKDGFACIALRGSESVPYTVTAISYPVATLNFSGTVAASTDSDELVQLLWIDLSDAGDNKYIQITYNTKSKIIWLHDEPKYEPVQFMFLNRYGSQAIVPFFKEKKETTSATFEQYESDYGQPSAGNHQFRKYNAQGKTKYTISSGWINRGAAEIYRELLLSTMVWVLDGSTLTPVNITTSEIAFKTRENNKMIQYEIQYEDSFNLINSI
jgi:hypothetical protein